MLPLGQPTSSLENLDAGGLSLFWAEEPLLGGSRFIVLYGSAIKENSTQNTSRVQAHIFSIGGYQSFPRLTIAPNSPLYVAVHHLPQDLQGDEICRGLAISILNYFSSLGELAKSILRDIAIGRAPNGSVPSMFDEMHAAQLASNMIEATNTSHVSKLLRSAFSPQGMSWIDVDMLMPPRSMKWAALDANDASNVDDNGLPRVDCGEFTGLIEELGPSGFLPTNKLKRAPSRPTSSNKLKSLSISGKLSIRKEMRELVSTEGNYIGKLQSLANTIAPLLAKVSPPEIHQRLFPDSLQDILLLHQSLYAEIHSIFESTEADAVREIENADPTSVQVPANVTQGRKRDVLGVTAFAKALSGLFPKLQDPYQQYLVFSKGFSSNISLLLNDKDSSCYRCIQEVGEQYLRSILIEPVQRLPRYSLFIDSIAQCLPFAHPARSSFLKARDTINKICDAGESNSHSRSPDTRSFSRFIGHWPATLNQLGRLSLATDVIELQPPYANEHEGYNSILLLFPESIVLVRRLHQTAMSALGLLAELDQFGTPKHEASLETSVVTGLAFERVYASKDTFFSESLDASSLAMTEIPLTILPHETLSIDARIFHLQPPFQGRASRLMEEIMRSKIEGRYTNETRESQHWTLRCSKPEQDTVGLQIAVTERKVRPSLQEQYNLGSIRIFVNCLEDKDIRQIVSTGARVVAHLHLASGGGVQIEAESFCGKRYHNHCPIGDIQSSIKTMLKTLLLTNDSIEIQRLMSFRRKVLDAMHLQHHEEESKRRMHRPKSPVKLLSNIFSAVSSQSSTPIKARNRAGTMEQTEKSMSTLSLHEGGMATQRLPTESPIKNIKITSNEPQTLNSSLANLEETFAAYIVALRSRSGNVVGKILQARSSANELAVNELYNGLLEDPRRLDVAAVVSVDVLFASFEKFQRAAWRDSMGPILSSDMITDLQRRVGVQDAKSFRQHFHQSLGEMSPQNRRAFAATLRLLADLLDAAGNDGDRGILIASFAEALVWTGNPHDCIMLFDRLTDEYDMFFEEVIHADGKSSSNTGSWGKENSVKANSVNSNTSSFRRRLGLGNLLQGPYQYKEEPGSKVTSIWRTLSKSGRNLGDVARAPNASMTSLVRSKSTDNDSRILSASRPTSRDRPTTAESGYTSGSLSRPQSSHSNGSVQPIQIDTITTKTPSVLRKKRRSSLSDLQSLKEVETASSLGPLKSHMRQKRQEKTVSLARECPLGPLRDQPRLSPYRSGIPRFRSPENKENSPSPRASPSKSAANTIEGVTVSTHPRTKPATPFSQLPITRSGLSERPWPPNSANIQPQPSSKLSPKMRVQSPQKSRQRLMPQSAGEAAVSAILQAEMLKIGEELSSLSRPSSSGNASSKSPASDDLQSLSRRLDFLQHQIDSFGQCSTTGFMTSSADIENKLKVAEKKVTGLDDLYKEANAENEALYDRFNDELGKILGRVRKGEGNGELKSKLADSQAEARRLKSENAKLKREIVDLKSL